jgi:hypothetical protein
LIYFVHVAVRCRVLQGRKITHTCIQTCEKVSDARMHACTRAQTLADLQARERARQERLRPGVVLSFLFLCVLVKVVAGRQDYFSILGVSPDASDEQVKRAYRKMALKHHPDKNKRDPEAATRFTEIAEAYEALKDADARRAYAAGSVPRGSNLRPFR